MDMSDDKLGFMMVRKSDGNTLYITKDISLAEVKFNQFKIGQSIYVVANEQDFHFKQLFNFLKKAGFEHADKCYHLSYGMVKRADGKMSSRSGNSFTFDDLVALVKESLETHMKKYKNQWSPEKIAEVTDQLAIGAIKYGMFKQVTTRIELPDGTKQYAKTINNDPEKYFTKDVMELLNEAASKELKYG